MAIATWAGYPRSYSPGRNRPVQYAVIHYTAGSEGPTSAEAGVAYDKTRPDGTSCHCFADSNTVLREVPDVDRAHAARYHGNEIGLQLELCGTAQTRDQWLDPVSSATLRLGAKQVAEWCRDHALPVRRLTVAETRAAYYNTAGNRPKGIVGHVDCTQAYPEDGGTHTDPGREFPWDVFLQWVSEELAALTSGGETDMDVNQSQKLDAIFNAWPTVKLDSNGDGKPDQDYPVPLTKLLKTIDAKASAPAPVEVDAEAVAAALASNTEFLAALAKAVNDDAAARLAG